MAICKSAARQFSTGWGHNTAMNREPMTIGLLIRRVLALTLLGFLVITLSGPLAVLIGFALVGWIVYSIYLMLVHQKAPASLRPVFHGIRQATAKVFRLVRWPVAKLWQGARGVTGITMGTLQAVYSIGCETMSGAILGAALGVLVGVPMSLDHFSVATGGVGGALFGFYLGWQHRRTQKRLQAKQKELEASLT